MGKRLSESLQYSDDTIRNFVSFFSHLVQFLGSRMPILYRRLAVLLIIGVSVISTPYTLFSQSSSSGLELDKLSPLPSSSIGSVLTAEQMPTDDVVIPSIYFLGPGDIISYRTTGIDFTEKMAVVTPENVLLMERFGMVDVTGLTLHDLRENLKKMRLGG